MPISATGNRGGPAPAAWVGPVACARHPARGFTLLEIMLVLAIMAVAVAVVVPDFFRGSGPALGDEARRLQMAMRLAAQDAQVDGVPVRWTATAQAYRFETWNAAGTWDGERTGPLRPHALPAGIRIIAVKRGQASFLTAMMSAPAAPDAAKGDGDRALGQVLFWPDGSLTMADIELVRDMPGSRKPQDSMLLRLRPGLAGIRLTAVGR